MAASFKQRLHNKELLVGTFVKTPSAAVCEVLGLSSIDVACLDAEHAPFDRSQLDSCVHALRSSDTPSLIRVAASSREYIQQALDYGATGVVVPHVMGAAQAAAIVQYAHFGEGGRGFAGSTRAAAYTNKPMQAHLADSAEATTVVLQIEDPDAVDAIDEIVGVPGIDCLFIGRVDLTVAYKADSTNDSKVVAAVEKVCEAALAAGVPVGMFVPNPDQAKEWAAAGVNLFLLSSDQSFILQGANSLVQLLKGK